MKNAQDVAVLRNCIIHAAALLYLAEAKSCSQKHRITPAIQDLREAYVFTLDDEKNEFDALMMIQASKLQNEDAAPREITPHG